MIFQAELTVSLTLYKMHIQRSPLSGGVMFIKQRTVSSNQKNSQTFEARLFAQDTETLKFSVHAQIETIFLKLSSAWQYKFRFESILVFRFENNFQVTSDSELGRLTDMRKYCYCLLLKQQQKWSDSWQLLPHLTQQAVKLRFWMATQNVGDTFKTQSSTNFRVVHHSDPGPWSILRSYKYHTATMIQKCRLTWPDNDCVSGHGSNHCVTGSISIVWQQITLMSVRISYQYAFNFKALRDEALAT